MKRDRFRECLQDAVEWYQLAATAPPSPMYRYTLDESEPTEGSYPAVTDSRPALRDMSIDMRKIVCGFLNELTEKHGSRRTERFIDWIHTGYIERYGREHRYQIKSDKHRLAHLIRVKYYGRLR
jgi:hypothetical protein